MFDFYASETHYAEHLLPVWFALDEEDRGEFYGPGRVAELLAGEGIHPEQSSPPLGRRPVVIAGWKDLTRCAQRPIALVEHGAGQTYVGIDNPSFSGGSDRERVRLFLCPSERVAANNRKRYPDTPAVAVGCPKLDRWGNSQMLGEPELPTVAVSFHWNSNLVPETRSALPAFKDHVAELARDPRFRVIGHGHPREFPWLRQFYAEHGIKPVAEFDEVVARASVYVCDNSSTIYEATFADIPTVLLNPPWYRRDVEHGLRFWDTLPGSGIGPDEDLAAAVWDAYETRDDTRPIRQEISRRVYAEAFAAIPAAQALVDHLTHAEGPPPGRPRRDPKRPMARMLPPILPERRFRRLGANGLVVNEARLRWVEMTPAERIEEQRRIAALTDRQLSAALAETLGDVLVGSARG